MNRKVFDALRLTIVASLAMYHGGQMAQAEERAAKKDPEKEKSKKSERRKRPSKKKLEVMPPIESVTDAQPEPSVAETVPHDKNDLTPKNAYQTASSSVAKSSTKESARAGARVSLADSDSQDDRTTRFGAAIDLRNENSSLNGELRISVASSDESFSYTPGSLGARLWMSRPLKRPSWRWLVSLTAEKNYGGKINNDRDEHYVFGALLEPTVGLEYAIKAGGGVDFPITARGGLLVLIPHSDFNQQIGDLEEVGAWPGPRLGWIAGLAGGFRKAIAEHWYFRGDVQMEYGQVLLLRTRAMINDTSYQKDWHLNILRGSFTAALEMSL